MQFQTPNTIKGFITIPIALLIVGCGTPQTQVGQERNRTEPDNNTQFQSSRSDSQQAIYQVSFELCQEEGLSKKTADDCQTTQWLVWGSPHTNEVRDYQPTVSAFAGITAYRTALSSTDSVQYDLAVESYGCYPEADSPQAKGLYTAESLRLNGDYFDRKKRIDFNDGITVNLVDSKDLEGTTLQRQLATASNCERIDQQRLENAEEG